MFASPGTEKIEGSALVTFHSMSASALHLCHIRSEMSAARTTVLYRGMGVVSRCRQREKKVERQEQIGKKHKNQRCEKGN